MPPRRVGGQPLHPIYALYQGFLGHAAWTGMLVGLGWTMLLWCAVLWCNRNGLYWKL